MTTFLRTRRFRGGVRHDFNLRDVKEEESNLAKSQFVGGVSKLTKKNHVIYEFRELKNKVGNMIRNSVFQFLHRYFLLQSRPTLPTPPPLFRVSQRPNRNQPR